LRKRCQSTSATSRRRRSSQRERRYTWLGFKTVPMRTLSAMYATRTSPMSNVAQPRLTPAIRIWWLLVLGVRLNPTRVSVFVIIASVFSPTQQTNAAPALPHRLTSSTSLRRELLEAVYRKPCPEAPPKRLEFLNPKPS